MSQYSFPILTDREVAQCLNELGMNATAEQLGKPTFEFVQPIYENLLTALMGITRCTIVTLFNHRPANYSEDPSPFPTPSFAPPHLFRISCTL